MTKLIGASYEQYKKAAGFVCAWRGCEEVTNGDRLPKGWWWVIAYESPTVLMDWWKAKHRSKQRRDTQLCPRHAFMLDQMLKPLPMLGEEIDDASH